jgi:2-polyprenyl-6-methoxyphenol hydroxylase-like FAD-dependent oxidoreductase
MTPFAGVGVNVAMEDALELAHSLVACKNICATADLSAHVGHLSTAVRTYEEAMFVRAESYAKETWMYLNLFFNKRGGHAMCEHFAEAKKQNAQEPQRSADQSANNSVPEQAATQPTEVN